MPGFVGRVLPVAIVLFPFLATLACAPSDPLARVAATRGHYEIQLSGWIVRPPEPPEVEPMAETEGEGDETASVDEGEETASVDEGEEGDLETMEDAGPDPREIGILFDVLVLFSGREPLPGITVDISHADADGNEKAARKHYLALEGTIRGSTRQIDFELDGWDFVDGDQFHVEMRQVVPDEERAAYREFQDAG